LAFYKLAFQKSALQRSTPFLEGEKDTQGPKTVDDMQKVSDNNFFGGKAQKAENINLDLVIRVARFFLVHDT
jgi:hypothetical protein